MKDKVFIAWSGSNKIALQVKAILEKKYNGDNYQKAIERLGGKDDWHKRLWWDVADINVK